MFTRDFVSQDKER